MTKQILTQAEQDRLADVIGELELKTCGELRVMIVGSSSVTGHVRAMLIGLLASLTLLGLWFARPHVPMLEEWWVVYVALALDIIVGTALTHSAAVRRGLTHYADMHHQVWARAEVEFHREGLSDTQSHTAVLLFVSLFERQAVVLADKAIADKVPPHTWDQVVATIVEGARTGQWAAKLEQALRECGAYLAAHFPPKPGKGNELPNTVIFKD